MKPGRRVVWCSSAILAIALVAGCKSPTARIREIGDQAKLQRVEADLSTLASCLRIYHLNSGAYPTEEQGLAALIERPTAEPVPEEWSQVIKAPLKDAWGRDYRYSVREKDGVAEPVISSGGPDPAIVTDDLERQVGSVLDSRK